MRLGTCYAWTLAMVYTYLLELTFPKILRGHQEYQHWDSGAQKALHRAVLAAF